MRDSEGRRDPLRDFSSAFEGNQRGRMMPVNSGGATSRATRSNARSRNGWVALLPGRLKTWLVSRLRRPSSPETSMSTADSGRGEINSQAAPLGELNESRVANDRRLVNGKIAL